MSEFLPAYEKTMKFEGGYANDPHDRGGETYRGISRKNWPGWSGWEQIDREKRAKDFPACLDRNADLQHRCRDFYQRNFWTPTMADIADQDLANWLFDKSVNMGINRANKLLQQALGVVVDGVMGPKSMAAIRSAGPAELLKKCRAEAKEFYTALADNDPSQKRFLKGWLARA